MSELKTKAENEMEEITIKYKISSGKLDNLFFNLYPI